MKKTIMLLGYIFLGILLLSVVGTASVYLLGQRLDRESQIYADSAVEAIASDWNIRELKKRASPELDSSLDYDEAEQYFKELRQLGRLVVYKGAVGQATITVSARHLYEITADYTAEVEYEAGSTQIQITLIKHGKQWQLLDFWVTPEEFSERSDVI